NRPEGQFIWNDVCYKTCKRCKENHSQKNKDNQNEKMPTIIDHELSQHKNIVFSSDLSDKSLNAYTLLQGAEKVPDEFKEEEYGIKNDVHNIVEEHSEVEHISNITHTEIDYLDLGNFIEHEIQELTAGAHIDEVANIIYQTHLLVCLDVTMVQ
ncbi:12998_t:CDS:1, partial [Ambispora gerdemannii]